MDKSRIRAWLLGAVLCALPLAGFAAGLGKLTLKSALGEPFEAEIEIVSAPGEDPSALVARIASADAYRDAGLTYLPALTGIKLSLEQGAGGAFLKATSARPVNEAFLELLIELRYASGRLLREYTVLLDPPVQPRAAPVSPPKAAAPARAPVEPAPSPAPEAPAAAAGYRPATADYTVRRGDTLSRIARGHMVEGVSVEQMLVALYRANEQAFMGRNMNRLKAGSILRIPEAGELSDVTPAEARGEVRAHTRDWNSYRQQLADAAAASTPEAMPRQAAAGKISAAVKDEAAGKEPGKDVLRLSKGEAPAAGVSGAASGAAQEELVAKDKALKEANQRISLLEKNIKDMQQLLELKNQELASLQKQAGVKAPAEPATPAQPAKPAEAAKPETPAQPAEAAKPAEKPTAAPEPAKPEPAKPAEAQPKPKPKIVAPPPPPPSLLEDILENPMLIPAVGALALLGIGYVGFNYYRRKKPEGGEGEGEGVEPVMASSEFERTHILGPTAAAAATGAAAGGEVDELLNDAANLVAWGRHAQAEEILCEALQKAPDRQDVQLRLLEVYAEQKNTAEFENVAKGLYSASSGKGPEWEKAVALGHALDPTNPFYGGSPAAAPAAPAAKPLEMDFSAPTVEVDVSAMTGTQPAAQPAAVDFDLDLGTPPDATAPNLEVTPEAAAPENIDFDLGILEEGDKRAAEPSMDDTIITEAEAEAEGGEATSIDFDLGFGGTGEAPAAAAQAAEAPIDMGISLDLPQTAGSDAGMTGSAEAEKLDDAGGVDFNFDIDLGDQAAPGAEQAAAAPTAGPVAPEFSLGDISLDLGEDQAAGTPEAVGSSDVAAKLDLAKAYQEMGDVEGASEILQEVLREGSDGEQQEARELLAKLS